MHRCGIEQSRLAPSCRSILAVLLTLASLGCEPTFAQAAPTARENSASLPPLSSRTLFGTDEPKTKFRLQEFMTLLRDNKHEGWLLTAYPDPKTSRPLIGAGFSLDVEETEHVQADPLNLYQFVEPSSAQLWQAAGLGPDRLQTILEEFRLAMKGSTRRTYLRKIKLKKISPQLTEEEALRLLRISAIQAAHNARAYCRNFDSLTASQQLGLSQLVFQMGVNLEQFAQFLGAMNGDNRYTDLSLPDHEAQTSAEHWTDVQHALIESQWARRYTTRAIGVIALFDPDYSHDPRAAQLQVEAVLHPPPERRRKGKSAKTLRTAHLRKRAGTSQAGR